MIDPEAYTQLYVATDLDHFPAKPAWHLAVDFRFDNKPYRRLDAAYYCWLRRQMDKAHAAFQRGRLAAESWALLRERFAAVHAWAVEHIGVEALSAANGSLPPNYRPPMRECEKCPLPTPTGIDQEKSLDDQEKPLRQCRQSPATRTARRNPGVRQQRLPVDSNPQAGAAS